MKLCWNGIVRNEAAIIERCVSSLLPYVDCGIVVDTGSTDGTPKLIQQMFNRAGKSIEIHYADFIDFEKARNGALAVARSSPLDWDYLLLADADMELRVRDPHWINGHTGLSYDMRQVGGALGYYNRRLVSRKAEGWFVGVTHEYIDIPSAGRIDAADFIDHADGANRPDKTARDILLLEAALRTETRPGLIERYTFYLANSYFELHNWDKAAQLYKQRVALGGFDEERWYAQLQYAKCFLHLEDRANFLLEMFRAFNMRPRRAEVLYELAQDFRVRGENESSLLFSEAGMQLPHPATDLLFVNDWVYKSGLREEFAVCAYYDPRRRSRGARETNKLALEGSAQARSNQFWYLKPLADDVPSFMPRQIKLEAPEGYVPCNPSVINRNDAPLILVRTVNYTINADGGYDIRDGAGACSDRNPIRTRNFLTDSQYAVELQLPDGWPVPKYALVRGFEDSRLFQWQGEVHTLSTVRELTHEGWCQQVLAPVVFSGPDRRYGTTWRQIPSSQQVQHEKNWMPWPCGDELRFVYRLGTLIDLNGEVVAQHDPGFDVSRISGGSQVVQADERTWLAIVHEAGFIPGRSNRFYQHRFVVFRPNGRVDRISAPFFFHDRQIEFCAGLAVFGKKLMVSYGVRDCEAWTATVDTDEVLRFVYKDAL
jgi:glycosyltransferase involved in cell wall biosynthesis